MHADRLDRDRWLASGMPDAMVTIMLRDGTLPPPSAARWYDSGLTTAEITEYRRTGRDAPDALGLPADAAFRATWDGLPSGTVLAAIDRGFLSAEHFRPWADTDADVSEVEQLAGAARFDGFDPKAALRSLRGGRPPAEIEFALASGITMKKASKWIDEGFDAATARSWSESGFSARRAGEWREVTDDSTAAARLVSLGFDPESALAARPPDGWSQATVRRELAARAGSFDWDLERWVQSAIADDELEAWVTAELGPELAAAWHAAGVAPLVAAAWARAEFTPPDAAPWLAAGVDPQVAARRRAAGVLPPSSPS